MEKATKQAQTKRIEDLPVEAQQADAVKGGGIVVNEKPQQFFDNGG